MGNLGIWQLLIILAIVVLLFGRGKIPELMGDVAKGIKSFKKGISDDDEKPADHDKTVDHTVEHRPDETKQG